MKYLITGGTGFIGQNFIKSLKINSSDNKNKIIILSRQNKNSLKSKYKVFNNFKSNIVFINNLNEIDNKEIIDIIINLAGSPIDRIWTKNTKQDLINSRINTTKSIISLVDRLETKPKIMISGSAIGYYGNKLSDEIVNENSNPEKSFTNDLCSLWEQEAKKIEKYNVRLCLVRLGVVLGKNGGFIKKTILPFKLGLGGKIGTGDQFFPWIHIDDVVAGFKYLIDNKNSDVQDLGNKDLNKIYNFTAPEFITNTELTKCIGKVLNKPTIFNIPNWFIKIVFREMGEELLLKGNKIYPKNLLESGYEFKFDTIEKALVDVLVYTS